MAAFGATVIRAGRRFLSSLPALFGVLVFTFLLMRVLPGDPAVFFASGPNAGKEEIEVIRKQMGLNKPVPEQLMLYLYDVGSGNLGRSMMTGQLVTKDLRERLPASLELTFTALLIALLSAVPLGVLAALRPGSIIDHGVRFFCALGVCVPTFVSGLLLIYVFYYLLGLAPDPTGRVDIFASLPPRRTGFLLIDFLLAGDFDGWWAAFRQLILPALSMALFVVAPLARITRASMLVSLGSDFVRTARSVGLPWWRVVVTYALRNAILPVITIAGIVFSTMLGANVLVEKVFSWPGVASYALDALLSSDYAPVQGFVLLMATVFVIVNLLGGYPLWHRRSTGDNRMTSATLRHAGWILRGNPLTAVAAAGVFLLTLIAIFGPWIVPYDPIVSNVSQALMPPSAAHIAGTDQLGRDVFSRLIVAARLDLAIAISAVGISFAIGAVIGAICGYTGGRLDRGVGRFVDVVMAFPLFVLAMAMVAALGNRVENIVIATAIINLPFYIRFARAEVNVRRNVGWVEAARACGDSHLSVVLRFLLPNVLPAMAVQISLNLGWAILNAAGLSFIGLGVKPPTPEWGIMVAEGARFISTGKWWLVAFPGLALMLTVLCFNLLGDGVRDILDPRMRT